MIGPQCGAAVSTSAIWRGLPNLSTFLVSKALTVSIALVVIGQGTAFAQIRPDVRDRVVPAVVQIVVIAEVSERGVVRPEPVFSGSGTLISPTGQILTNWHVVDMVGHQEILDAWEEDSAGRGQPISANLIDAGVVVLISDGERAPVPQYVAEIVEVNRVLDLAVLQITDDGSGPVDRDSLDLPFVSIGDSDELKLGDPVDLFGFPGIGGGALTYTTGVVSGFITDSLTGRVWVNTDATMASGSSGGTAINREGELIGIPTQGTLSGCRPGDMNRDGTIDARDDGCLVEPGAIGQLRPINLALDLIDADGGTSSDRGDGDFIPPPIDLYGLLPDVLPLDHASCFDIDEDGQEDLAQVLGRFSGASDATDRLQTWGWQGSAFRQFGCDGPPEGEAGWMDISIHLFADSLSAQEAVDYFTAVRLEGSSYIQGASPEIGDYSTAMSGPAVNGKDFTVYASQGPVLVRVTGVSPSGIPFMNVLAVANAVLANLQEIPQSPSTTSSQGASRPASAYLPASPDVRHRDCFDVLTEGTYAYGDVAEALQATGLSQAQFADLGWQDGAYRVFTCEEPPFGRASHIEVIIHRFRDGQAAQRAEPYLAGTTGLGANETRSCDTADSLVICIFGRSLTGSPLSDVAFVLQQVTSAAR